MFDPPHSPEFSNHSPSHRGTAGLPLLEHRQTGNQRALLKVQDGCDAHCTYCIIPKLRPALWSKQLHDAVAEAQRLVDAGHVELVLTGVFLGAYGQTTALHRRQIARPEQSLASLVDSLCRQVHGLRRLRLSSLEPADLTPELISAMGSHPQLVPHFHLPLQSGSDVILKKMNRQYSAGQFLQTIERLNSAFDRPAITTDIITGFPGETEAEFAQTMAVVEQAKFIHIHAFPFSSRPGTAAARWKTNLVPEREATERVKRLESRAREHSFTFRQQFEGTTAEVLVERPGASEADLQPDEALRHGRCERYFPIHFEGPKSLTGQCVKVRIERVTPHRTLGRLHVDGGQL